MQKSKLFKQPDKKRFTGNQLVLLQDDHKDAAKTFHAHAKKVFGANVHTASDSKDAPMNVKKILRQPGAVILPTIGVAIVNAPSKQMSKLVAVSGTMRKSIAAPLPHTEPERYVYALQEPVELKNYLKGFRDATEAIYKGYEIDPGTEFNVVESLDEIKQRRKYFKDNNSATWGLQATRVLDSPFTGQGVKLAVLDSGLFSAHPDFAGRSITSQSFVPNENTEDGLRHGTHTAGTAAGHVNLQTGRRYGVAYNCDLHIGKVLDNSGEGTDGQVLAGIEWAINSGCRIISMSLGSGIEDGESYSRVYERVAQRALSSGSLIIAAAGNSSDRPSNIAAVNSPANCPSIFAVGAIDNHYKIGEFSCGQKGEDGGQVDIAGPGVDVYSSSIEPDLYASLNGTSMATPHVSGIAALYAEKFPKASAHELWMHLTSNAKRLNLPSTDVGSGLVQAPK